MTLFILHSHSQPCSCGRVQQWSHIYEAEIAGAGTRLKPATFIPLSASITTERMSHPLVPMCSACLPLDAASRGDAAKAAWEETRKRKQAQARAESASVKPLKPITELA